MARAVGVVRRVAVASDGLGIGAAHDGGAGALAGRRARDGDQLAGAGLELHAAAVDVVHARPEEQRRHAAAVGGEETADVRARREDAHDLHRLAVARACRRVVLRR